MLLPDIGPSVNVINVLMSVMISFDRDLPINTMVGEFVVEKQAGNPDGRC